MFEDGGKWYVTHKNEDGTHLESLYDFLNAGRKVLRKSAHQCVSAHQIRIYHAEHKDEGFSLLSNNCEHYVSGFRKLNNETVLIASPQVATISAVVLLAIAAIVYYYRKRK